MTWLADLSSLKFFKSGRLNIISEIYNEARSDIQRTIKQKKKQYLQEKLSQNKAKPNEIWQILKSLTLPKKKNSLWNICLKNKNNLLYNLLSVAETFKKYYSSSAGNLALKLPKPLNNFGTQLGNNYYKNCNVKERLLFAKIESDRIYKITKNFDKVRLQKLMIFQEPF